MPTHTEKSDSGPENIQWTPMPHAETLRRIRRSGYSEVVVVEVDAIHAVDEKAARDAQGVRS